jgi:putative ABC transport system permease protein
MLDLDKWQEIFGTIKKNKLRTILTAFSVAWGIFILIILLGAGQGLRNGAQEQFSRDAVNSIEVWGGLTSMPYEGYKTGRMIQFNNDDYYELKNNTAGVEKATAHFANWDSRIISYKNEHAGFFVRACAPDHAYLEQAQMITGRFINEIDFNEFRKVAVIGFPVKDLLFKNEDPIGKMIDISGTKYTVVGVFTDPGKGDRDRIYIPLLTAQRVYNAKNKVNGLWVSTGNASTEESEAIVENIREKFSKKYHFNKNDKNAIGIQNYNVEYKRIMGMLDGIKWFIYVIGALTLIAGVVGISNIMLIVVKERTKEIGVRKALGASPWSIVSLIIQESIFITAMAGYIGLMLGIGVIELIKWIGVEGDFFKRPEVDLGIAVWSVVAIIIAGALAGLIPAIKAASVEPITALREN